ncbi:hypothetical protein BpHYR1_000924 [Brachionus plicatilis]|uniref:Uncharacterized protein n=1 Tax=Brachionus plicatilis TaxID=10195 RepID=A0A3M7QAH6_BRAPC|nr:hypothetical protein BpHYR1_000924 [Brachionus plicatilis]
MVYTLLFMFGQNLYNQNIYSHYSIIRYKLERILINLVEAKTKRYRTKCKRAFFFIGFLDPNVSLILKSDLWPLFLGKLKKAFKDFRGHSKKPSELKEVSQLPNPFS